ncbi:MAG: DinB family protein [Candidatus Dormibacteraeota bacterium]|nr:DinB family protein [Candidatus Dormibacteraeota bacterium]
MRVAEADVAELRDYVARIVALLPRLDLGARVGGGAGVGQLAFHAAESADHWIRLRMLGDERPRDRDAEFAGRFTREEIADALGRALDACDELVRRAPELGERCPNPPAGSPEWTVLNCLVHASAHTAEHVGHLESTVG